jgi:hypothetical protein
MAANVLFDFWISESEMKVKDNTSIQRLAEENALGQKLL